MERMTAVQELRETGYMLTYNKQPPGNPGFGTDVPMHWGVGFAQRREK